MKIREEARDVPVFHEADICVLGGSCTGVFAAVRAARLGAKVVIVEKMNAFGGVATSGLVNIWHSLYNTEFDRQIIAGMTLETVERLSRIGACSEQRRNHSSGYVLNTEELKIELDRLIQEEGVKPYLHTMFVSPYLEDGKLTAVVVENKSGRGAIRARIFVDATGDGDLCDRLGIGQRISAMFQPSTTCAKIEGWNAVTKDFDLSAILLENAERYQIPEGFGWGAHVPDSNDVYMYAGTRVYHANSADGEALTYSEMEGRRQVRAVMDLIRNKVEGSKLSLVSLPSYIGTRETRHIDCHYRLTGEDVLHGRMFEDAIANGSYRVDIHHQNKPGLTFKYLNGEEIYIRPGYPQQVGRWREKTEVDPTFYQIPFRSLLPKGSYDNIIVAGRMLDADEEAFGGVRVMVNMNQTGEAAGVAAYLALDGDKGLPEIHAYQVREKLAQGGSILL